MEELKPKFTLDQLRERDAANLEQRKEIFRKKIHDAIRELDRQDKLMAAKDIMLRAHDISKYRSKDSPIEFTRGQEQRASNLTHFLIELKDRWEAVKSLIDQYTLEFPDDTEFDELLSEYSERYEN